LFVGRYDDGAERYVRWGKQFRELFEMFFDDTGFSPVSATIKKLGGKAAPALQLTSQITTGVALSGFRNDDVFGKKGWEKTFGIFKTILKAPLPFSSRSILSDNKEFHISDLAFPSSKGMSRYKAMEYFKYALVKHDERFLKEVYQDSTRNGLPAYTLFNAALTSLKAETTRELNRNRNTLEDVSKALSVAVKSKNVDDIERIKNRLKRITKERMEWELAEVYYIKAIIEAKKYSLAEERE